MTSSSIFCMNTRRPLSADLQADQLPRLPPLQNRVAAALRSPWLKAPACLAAVACLAGPAAAQTLSPGEQPLAAAVTPADEPNMPLRLSMELNAGAQSLSNGYGDWKELGLRGTWAPAGAPRHTLQGELSTHERFDETGTYVGISDTYTFNEDWYGSLAVGAGDGAFFLPNYRVDATLYRKWLADRSLVSSVGAGYYDAPDGHTDRNLSLGLIYYFKVPVVVEGGVRFNSSNPGAIRTNQQFVALTWGREKQDLVSLRYGWGGEGYLSTSAATQLVDFDSDELSISWRHWLTDRAGVLVSANRYSNPLYTRTGLNVGFLYAF
ncbi:MAG: YaiO family outer membrane beta-barrel protein [Polaromonas sp.]|nr:YaiO family outer membrane beta-barrel protein [Polaromonas sp.]